MSKVLFVSLHQIKTGVVMNVCNPSSWKQRQKDPKLKVIFGYIAISRHYMRPCLKERKKEKSYLFSLLK